jgi:hypothetical protein
MFRHFSTIYKQTKIQDFLQMFASNTVINNKFISDSGKNELNYNYKQLHHQKLLLPRPVQVLRLQQLVQLGVYHQSK